MSISEDDVGDDQEDPPAPSGVAAGSAMRQRASLSCTNLAALESMSSPSSMPAQGRGRTNVSSIAEENDVAFSVEATPSTSMSQSGAPAPAPVPAMAPARVRGANEDSRLSEILSKCRAQGLRMSITVRRGISSLPASKQG